MQGKFKGIQGHQQQLINAIFKKIYRCGFRKHYAKFEMSVYIICKLKARTLSLDYELKLKKNFP